MVSKKQGFRTVVFVIIFAVAIVGGVFGISYYKGGVTFPWEISSVQPKEEVAAVEPEVTEQKQTVVEKEEKTEAVKPAEEEVPEVATEETESASAFVKNEAAKTGVKYDYYGALSVEDGKLVDSDGNVAQLVGVSSHGINWFPEFISEDSIVSLRDNWGINVIRLAMYTSDYNGYCVGGNSNQQDLIGKIEDAVDVATANDMYVIIDWHILNDSNPNEYKSEAIQFFGEMVRKYEDNDNVIYEICNEPNGDTTWADIKSYANEVIPVIRNVDEDAIVLVGTPEWSSDLDSVLEDPLEFDNIMYTYHFYAASHKASARNKLTAALDEGLPVFISEYGLVSSDGNGGVDSKESDKWYEIIDEYKLSSCIWNLSNKDEGSALISSECQSVSNWRYDELSEEGKYFIDKLSEESNTEDDN